MIKYSRLPLILFIVTFTGCAQHSKIIVDPKYTDMKQYEIDLAECQQLAGQVESKTGAGVVSGALKGALVGEIINDDSSTRVGAQLGALGGGVSANRATKHERIRVVKNCLRQRGYKLLN